MIILIIILFLIIGYLIFKPTHRKNLPKTAFDEYLIKQHQQSLDRASKIKTAEVNDNKAADFVINMYLDMLAERNDPELRKEAIEALHVNYNELDELIKGRKNEKTTDSP